MIDKTRLHLILNEYKKDFPKLFWTNKTENEKYKWVAVKHFQDNWDIDAEDFSEMLTKSLAKTENLLASQSSFPKGMIIAFSKANPEEVRKMFKRLFDEKISVVTRIEEFMKSSEEMRSKYEPKDDKGWKSHYQNPNSISTYLWLRYPDKYYIYKYSEVKEVANELDRSFKPAKGAKPETILGAIKLYDELAEYFATDSELVDLVKSHLDDSCYPDPEFRTLAIDVGFYISRYYEDKQTQKKPDVWWPSLDVYNPKLSKEDWKKFINEVENFNHQGCMRVLKCFLEIGGEASSKKLSEMYGGHPSVYSSSVLNTSKRAIEYFNLKTCPDDDKERYFPVAFQGKNVGKSDLYTYKMRDELLEALAEIDLSNILLFYEDGENEMTNVAKNTILYGPPGTGKTYNTVVYAVAVIENKTVEAVKAEAYSSVFERYNTYKNEGLIEFTTFHQSYGYEEFIEGIKPVLDNDSDEQGDVKYTVEDGLFKAFCNKSSMPITKKSNIDIGLNKTPTIWKVSLWSTGDNPTRTECLENGHIRIGWDDYGADITEDTDYSVQGGKKVLNAFISRMKIGDIVFSCYSSTTIDAIGVVTGDYEWCGKQYDDGLNRRRKVNWIVKGINEDIVDINGGSTMTLSAVYRLKNIALSDAMAIIEKYLPHTAEEKKNHVFIIDEINRGNISKIFGELITLIEPSKRLGQSEGMKAKLPYSQQLFGVPDNVYLIGTMNTADRSIATIDTALRRRFRFKEMMPDADVLNGIVVDEISISDMLTRMNKRIAVLYDREHTVGHAYFIPLKDNPTLELLSEIFENGIIPLLQEYFYEDYEKIRLVLGDNKKDNVSEQFIIAVENDYDELFGSSDIGFDDSMTYEINKDAFGKIEAYKSI